eukprot:gnl/TRDRNA2_/TRDRNA2_86720_c1_seq1.p1 gnl/TRDRNA2_/TRDRNA2_86720_c1~~gnl/TRDRNA2_/TRDRNA2_86720_c1_seq1.p1  ORF type:complete len:127 (+),score=14.65 gnl/TRDRNA2_/TRDRNA2_86720_c1_seq1:50-382(+)
MADQVLPDLKDEAAKVPVISNMRTLALGDVLRLSKARDASCPYSFGTVAHFAPVQPRNSSAVPCRPCMFERWAGRCSKKWLCDFCHLHTGERRKKGKKQASDEQRGIRCQ